MSLQSFAYPSPGFFAAPAYTNPSSYLARPFSNGNGASAFAFSGFGQPSFGSYASAFAGTGTNANAFAFSGFGYNPQPVLPQYDPPKPVPPNPVKPPPPPRPPVAANEKARIWGDPHIVDADDKSGKGVSYDVHDPGTWEILNDKNVNINATFTPWRGNAKVTVITDAGLKIPGGLIKVTPQGVWLDGKPMAKGETKKLKDGTELKLNAEGNSLEVNTPDSQEFKHKFEIVGAAADASHGGYVNIDVMSKGQGVMSDGIRPTGMLGETFDADNEVGTGLRQKIETYARKHIFDGANRGAKRKPTPQPAYGGSDPMAQLIALLMQLLNRR